MLSGARTQSPDRAPPRTLARRSESDIVAELRAALATSSASVEAVTRRGLDLIRKAKADGERETLVAQLMNRSRLSTEDGVVLMCLAEALLRVPDNAPAHALTRATIAGRPQAEGDADDSPLAADLPGRGMSTGPATRSPDAEG